MWKDYGLMGLETHHNSRLELCAAVWLQAKVCELGLWPRLNDSPICDARHRWSCYCGLWSLYMRTISFKIHIYTPGHRQKGGGTKGVMPPRKVRTKQYQPFNCEQKWQWANVWPVAAYQQNQRSNLWLGVCVGGHLAADRLSLRWPEWTLAYGGTNPPIPN